MAYVISQAMHVVLLACSTLISIDSNFNVIAKHIILLFRAQSLNNNFRGSKNYTRMYVHLYIAAELHSSKEKFLSELHIKVKKEH